MNYLATSQALSAMINLNNPNQLSFSSLSLHADDPLSATTDIAPAIHVSTTFSKLDPNLASSLSNGHEEYVYSRYTTVTRDRAEQVLGSLNKGHAVTYSSGLSAGFAALLHVKPDRVAIRGGYHGTHGFINIYKRHRDIVS